MAITEVTTVDIKAYDADNNLTTYKIDNPKNNLTKAQVLAAFAPAIEQGFILVNSGAPLARIGDVIRNQSIKTDIEGEPVYFTPAEPSLVFTPSGDYFETTTTIAVTNAPVQAVTVNSVNFTGLSGNFFNTHTTVTATNTESNITVKVIIHKESAEGWAVEFSGTAVLEVVVQGVSLFLNVTLSNS